MRNYLHKLFLLLLAMCWSFGLAMAADTFTVGDFQYEVLKDGTSVEVKAISGIVYEGEITIPGQVTHPETNVVYTVTEIGNYGFEASSSRKTVGITSLILSEGIKIINIAGFKGLKNLTSVRLPNTIEKFGDAVFSGCTALKTLSLPGSLKEASGLGSGVLLDELTFEASTEPLKGTSGLSVSKSSFSAKKVYVNRDLMSGTIDVAAEEVWFGGEATTINVSFKGAENLTKVNFSPDCKLNEIIHYAFEGCTGLKSIDLPDCITKVGQRAFSGCTNLQSIDWPTGTTKVEIGTFEGCSALRGIYDDDCNITDIQDYAFKDCTSLVQFELPYNLVLLEQRAFAGCTSLEEVEVSSRFHHSLATIGSQVFDGCIKLKHLAIPSTVTTLLADAFAGLELEKFTFMAPNYNDASQWRDDDKELIIHQELDLKADTIIIGHAFVRDGALCKDPEYPKVLFLGGDENRLQVNKMFAGCTQLTDVYAPWITRTASGKEQDIPELSSTAFSADILQHATLWVKDEWETAYRDKSWNFSNIKPYWFDVTSNFTIVGENSLNMEGTDYLNMEGYTNLWTIDGNYSMTFPYRLGSSIEYSRFNLKDHYEVLLSVDGGESQPIELDPDWGTYGYENVNHKTTLDFTIKLKPKCTVKASVDGTGGTVALSPYQGPGVVPPSPSTNASTWVYRDEDAKLTIKPENTSKKVDKVMVNGEDWTDKLVSGRSNTFTLDIKNIQTDTTIKVTFKDRNRYDLNNDDVVDDKDVAIMTSYILGKKEYSSSADFNRDTKITVLDLVKMINEIK